jgi:hypothetical protein
MPEHLSYRSWTTEDLFREKGNLTFLIDGYPESEKLAGWKEDRRRVLRALEDRGFKFRKERDE